MLLGGGVGEERLFAQTCAGDPSQLLFPLDSTFARVDFCGDGPQGSGPAVCPDQHNDDDSATVRLPFGFELYGDRYDTAYVNNNGNVTFGSFFGGFTASGFPLPAVAMLAPFWADVDTGDALSPLGDIWLKFFDTDDDGRLETLVVTWDDVGHFDEQGDRRNTFQVAISDGTSPVLGLGQTVCFSYANMCWTTGDASGGSDGFGGVPATAGANKGDGEVFFQVGRFDRPGDLYDGPLGANDGVDHLDAQTICFRAATVPDNVPPIATNLPPSNRVTLDASAGASLDLEISFLSPENDQTTMVEAIDLDGAFPRGLVAETIAGNPAAVYLAWKVGCEAAGVYRVELTATDDASPPAQTSVTLAIEVACDFPRFVRGDCNSTTTVDLLDVMATLFFVALGTPVPPCLAACDSNHEEAVNLADAIYLLHYLFSGGIPPNSPFPLCGIDREGVASCTHSPGCP